MQKKIIKDQLDGGSYLEEAPQPLRVLHHQITLCIFSVQSRLMVPC